MATITDPAAIERLRTAVQWAHDQADGDMSAKWGGEWVQSAWACCVASKLCRDYEAETGQSFTTPWAGGEAALGVEPYGVEDVFWGGNTLEDLWTTAALLTDGQIADPRGIPSE